MNRRALLHASAGVAIAAASVSLLPAAAAAVRVLTVDELCVLAIAKSPPPATWDQYEAQRTFTSRADHDADHNDGTELEAAVFRLEQEGLLERHPYTDRSGRAAMYMLPTELGRHVLEHQAGA